MCDMRNREIAKSKNREIVKPRNRGIAKPLNRGDECGLGAAGLVAGPLAGRAGVQPGQCHLRRIGKIRVGKQRTV